MVETYIPKHKLVSTGYAEMPMDGRRYRFKVERYVDDEGNEWGRIVDKEEIPDTGLYLWIPSYGVTEAAEAEYLTEEWEYEKTHPDPVQAAWLAEHREMQAKRMALYNEARDARVEYIRRNPVTFGRK